MKRAIQRACLYSVIFGIVVVIFGGGIEHAHAAGTLNMLIANSDPCEPGASDHCDPTNAEEGLDTITYDFVMDGTDDVDSTFRLQFGTSAIVDTDDAATDLTVTSCGTTVVLENAPTIDNTNNACTAATWDGINNQVLWNEASSCTTGDTVRVTWDIRFCSGSGGSTFDFDIACTRAGGHANCGTIEYLDEWDVNAPPETKPASLVQHGYKWFANTDSVAVGGAAGANSPTIAPRQGTPFRLRMLLYNEGVTTISTNGTTTDLMIALRDGDGVCDGDESYSEVSPSSGVIRYHDNAGAADNAALTASSFDPVATSSGVTVRNQAYEEANTFTNSVAAIAENEAGLWDFALIDVGAPSDTTYCFRAEQDDAGTNFILSGGYDQFPEITTAKPVTIRLRGAIVLRTVRLR